jgi:D-glycero-D-manno-heptose 1,7-bisphosphate phosphatase
MNAAIFLDRDGVLIEDAHLLTDPGEIRVLEGVPQALGKLKQAGFKLIVVSNQTVVARGLATEQEVYAVNAEIDRLLEQAGGPHLDGFYFCPHHPNATLPAYRIVCECRKPRPGLLLRAAREHDVNLGASFAVGDRITDVIAGARAGCRTVLIQTGEHQSPLIETVEPLDETVQPDHVCADLRAAARWILRVKNKRTRAWRQGDSR